MSLKKYRERAQLLDKNDPLAAFKFHFFNPKNVIYLDGNSLGKLPKRTIDSQANLIAEQWGSRLIRSWNESWISMGERTAQKIAKLLGAAPDEVFVGDTTSLNLYKLAFAAISYSAKRNEIVSDDLNFPTDLYVFQGLINNHFPNHKLRLAKSLDGMTITTNEIKELLNDNTSLLSLSAVSYKSAFKYDMTEINKIARENGTLTLWDLSHAAGAVPIDLNGSNTDMAVGCTYKYLNGGPGAPAFLYVSKELQAKLDNPIWSWFSHKAPFDFSPNYAPDKSIQKFAVSTPTILSLDPVLNGVDLLLEAGMDKIHVKSVAQTNLLYEMISQELTKYGFTIGSPENDGLRGSHIAIIHEEGYRINAAMINPSSKDTTVVIPDFRPPNSIRLGIAPLYTSFVDLVDCVERIKQIMDTGEFKEISSTKPKVV